MKRLSNLTKQGIICTLYIFLCNPFFAQSDNHQPNIVWLVTEDNSKHFLQLYEESGVSTPNIEALAKNGIVFNNAFSNAPVCSVSRSTLISGCYAPRIGAQYHRKMQLAPMPDSLEMFPAYLRKAGYYTTNNSKEDYNLIKSENVWDASSKTATYRNRKPGQPFFHVQNFGITHEGKLHFSKGEMQTTPTNTPTSQILPFPCHPNTPLFRYTYARYYDLHQKADAAIGSFIKQLEGDGLMDDTIIFYYGDHGGVLPGSKGYVYESGLHVPLVVYIPEKWKHLMPLESGSRTDAFVQFIDMAPTVLNLAGISSPVQYDGKPFLGKDVSVDDLEKRSTAFSYADRFDEKYDLVRALRKGRYKYIRNYQPFNIDGLFNFYRYKMLAYKEWKHLFEKGELNDSQRQFFLPRSAEALYDIEEDPHEVHNLIDDVLFTDVLEELRSELKQKVKSMPDLSFFPESHFLEHGIMNPVQFGQENKGKIAELIDIADLSLLPFSIAENGIKEALESKDPWKRYWGLIVCSSFDNQSSSFFGKAKRIAKSDRENLVRIRAVEFLALNGQAISNRLILDIVKSAHSETEANLMLNTLALIKTVRPEFQLVLPNDLFNAEWTKRKQDLVSRRVEFINK